MPLVQKFIVEDVDKASPLLPQHIALVNADGSAYTGAVAAHVDPDTGTVKEVIQSLIAAGIMAATNAENALQTAALSEDDAAGEANEAADTASTDDAAGEANEAADTASTDDAAGELAKPTEASTVAEIRAYASQEGIELPSSATKAELLAIIS